LIDFSLGQSTANHFGNMFAGAKLRQRARQKLVIQGMGR
jgi:hypothetical protein